MSRPRAENAAKATNTPELAGGSSSSSCVAGVAASAPTESFSGLLFGGGVRSTRFAFTRGRTFRGAAGRAFPARPAGFVGVSLTRGGGGVEATVGGGCWAAGGGGGGGGGGGCGVGGAGGGGGGGAGGFGFSSGFGGGGGFGSGAAAVLAALASPVMASIGDTGSTNPAEHARARAQSPNSKATLDIPRERERGGPAPAPRLIGAWNPAPDLSARAGEGLTPVRLSFSSGSHCSPPQVFRKVVRNAAQQGLVLRISRGLRRPRRTTTSPAGPELAHRCVTAPRERVPEIFAPAAAGSRSASSA
jgi:hypothetical protein